MTQFTYSIRRVSALATRFKTHSLVGRFNGNFELDPTEEDVDDLTDEDAIIELLVFVVLVLVIVNAFPL